jgi:hypothetical protein
VAASTALSPLSPPTYAWPFLWLDADRDTAQPSLHLSTWRPRTTLPASKFLRWIPKCHLRGTTLRGSHHRAPSIVQHPLLSTRRTPPRQTHIQRPRLPEDNNARRIALFLALQRLKSQVIPDKRDPVSRTSTPTPLRLPMRLLTHAALFQDSDRTCCYRPWGRVNSARSNSVCTANGEKRSPSNLSVVETSTAPFACPRSNVKSRF